MDPIIRTPGPDMASNQNDPSYQVMPQQGSAPEDSSAPQAEREIPAPNPVSEMQIEQDNSSGGRRIIYIILGIVILVIAAGFAYFLLGSKPASKTQTQAVTSQLPSVWLQQYFNKTTCDDQSVCGDSADPDNDGLTNLQEFKTGTNPLVADTDGDGLSDGDEVNIFKTDPTLKFTDTRPIVSQNNWTDGFQIAGGYDPLNPGQKFTPARLQQINDDINQFHLHAPSIQTLANTQFMMPGMQMPTTTPATSTSSSGTASPATNSSSPTSQAPASPSTHNVSIANFAFAPNVINVNKGDTVVWKNTDAVGHTVTGDNGGPQSGVLGTGQTYSFTFTTSGTFNYHCSIHTEMTATVIVN